MSLSQRSQPWIETALVLLVFFIEGAYPVPEVNEPYYLGKAIHFWNPAWGAGDFFLESADAHEVFYVTFGWLGAVLPPTAFAWTLRIITWTLLAWAWRRLSWAIVPRAWFSILSAALFVAAVDRFHMAGEWVVGGAEAKGFAYVLVFLGLESIVVGRWNRGWLLLGGAAAFHVVVGGWSVVAAAVAWGLGRRQATAGAEPAPSLRSMLPGLVGGGLLSLFGLVPVLTLNWGVDAAVVREASQIYVYERLYHHLDPLQIPPWFVVRFVLLTLGWAVLCLLTPAAAAARVLRRFVAGTLLIACCGGTLGLLEYVDRAAAASLLRYYWFRLADAAVPMGVALEAAALVAWAWQHRPIAGRWLLGAATLLAGLHVGSLAAIRPVPQSPPAVKLPSYETWRDVNDWIAASPQIPRDARFLTPRLSQTFKWYTGLAEVVDWKEIPQNAPAIVEWYRRLKDIYGTVGPQGQPAWRDWPHELPPKKILQLSRQYDFRYVLSGRRERLPFKRLYHNEHYAVYELPSDEPREAEPGN